MSTQENIIQSARALIMQSGYNGFSYADIADRVAIRKASVHHYFPAKADLALAVVKQSRAGIQSHAAALDTGEFDPVEQLRAYVGYWERCIEENSAPFCVAGMLAAEMTTLPAFLQDEVRLHFQDLQGWVERVLTRGASTGQIHLKKAASLEANTFIALVYGAMLVARASNDPKIFAAITSGGLAKLINSP